MRFEGLRSILRNFTHLTLGHLASVVLRFLYLLILVRWLSPDDYGKLSYGMAWYLTFIVFTYLGQETVLSRGIGRGIQDAATLLSKTLVQRVFAIGVVAIGSIAAAIIGGLGIDMLWILAVFTLAMAGRSLWMWSASCFVAMERVKSSVAVDLIFRTLEILCVVGFVFLCEPSILGVAAIHAAGWSVQGVVGALRAWKAMPRRVGRGVDGSVNLFGDGAAGAAYAFGLTWFLQAPVLLFGYFGDTGAALGHFALAFQLVGHVQIIPYLLGVAALPVLSRSAMRRDGKDRTLALVILATVPVAGIVFVALGALIGPAVITLLFGEEYAFTADVLVPALWLLIPLGIAVMLQQFSVAATQQSLLGTVAPLAGIVVMALLYGPMTASQGYKGAILATGVGMTVWAGLVLGSLLRTGFFRRRSLA